MIRHRKRFQFRQSNQNGGLAGDGDRFLAYNGMVFLGRAAAVRPELTRPMLEHFFACLGFGESLEMLSGFSCKVGEKLCAPFNDLHGKYSKGEIDDIDDLARNAMERIRRREKILSRALLKAVTERADEFIDRHRAAMVDNDVEKKLKQFSGNFAASELEQELLRLLLVMRGIREADHYFDDCLSVFSMTRRRLLAALLESAESELRSLGRGVLVKLEIINWQDRNGAPGLDSSFDDYLESPDDLSRGDSFIQAQAPQLAIDDHFIDGDTRKMLLTLLADKSEHPTHLLFYGPPGVGKTQLARALAQASGAAAYEVLPEAPGQGGDHRGHLLAAYNLTRQGDGAVLIIDEADDLLNTSRFNPFFLFTGRDRPGKTWLDYFMDQPGARCIWIVNDTGGLDQAVMRRFAFSLHFPRLGNRERKKIWGHARLEMEGLGGAMLSGGSIDHLADQFNVSAGVISQALRTSLRIGPGDETHLRRYLEKNLEAYLDLSDQPAEAAPVSRSYRLSALNTDPAPPEFLARLAAWREWNRDRSQRDREGLSLLFHGLPGTGKSELGRYLARHLDMELMHRRASDILAPYVGVSERIVAETFREAEAKGAVVLIDEVETFFLNRDRVRQPWELSLVNEFLTRLESFRGLFIGTTNRFGDLDLAALRRFSQKVRFDTLKPAGRLELFESVLAPLSGQPLSDGERQLLDGLAALTPGDFKVAADRYRWNVPGAVSNLDLLEALKGEASLRVPAATEPPAPSAQVN